MKRIINMRTEDVPRSSALVPDTGLERRTSEFQPARVPQALNEKPTLPPPAPAAKTETPADSPVRYSRKGMGLHFRIVARVSPYFRRRRTQAFLDLFKPTPNTRILDVGGLPRCWEGSGVKAPITFVNLQPFDDYEASFMIRGQTFVVADGTKLPWKDGSFDIVYSNSVIEHVGTAERQKAFASECQRVGKGHWIQTPARECPIEPHYFTLFLHWFPKSVQKRLVPRLSLWGWLVRPNPQGMDAVLDELRLMRRREFRALFPKSWIQVERLVGFPKSYIAIKLPGNTSKAARINMRRRASGTLPSPEHASTVPQSN
jgi:hypothetical protein